MRVISKMVLRMYLPSAFVAVAGLVGAEVIKRMDDLNPHVAARSASIAFLLAILLGLAWASYSSWRLWRWLKGREERCECGGMISRPRRDRQGRHYRKCLACGGRKYLAGPR